MNFEGLNNSKKEEDIFGDNDRARELDMSEIDGTTFFDENESRHGASHVDEATGERYQNDTDMDSESPEMHAINSIIDMDNRKFDPEDDVTKMLRKSYKDHPNRDEELLKLNIDPRIK
jgi:hypothetical protein